MVTPKLVFIQAGGPQLGADLYLPPSAAGPVPAVVTGSGFGGVKEMLLPHFASALAEAGVATLAIDYAGFGMSAGEPRQDLDPQAQIRDLRRGLDYLVNDPRVDATRLGAFGPSMCGAHVLVLAGSDARVRAIFVLGFPATMVPDPEFLHRCAPPRLFVQGERDVYAPAATIRSIVDPLPEPKSLTVVPEADHFFAGQLDALQEAISSWAAARPWEAA